MKAEKNVILSLNCFRMLSARLAPMRCSRLIIPPVPCKVLDEVSRSMSMFRKPPSREAKTFESLMEPCKSDREEKLPSEWLKINALTWK